MRQIGAKGWSWVLFALDTRNHFRSKRYPTHIHVVLSPSGPWAWVSHDTLMHGLRLCNAKGRTHHAHLHLHLQHSGRHCSCHARGHCAIQCSWISHARHRIDRLLLLWVWGLGLGCRGIRATARHGWLLPLHLLHGLQLFQNSAPESI